MSGGAAPFNLTATDREVLDTKDEDFHYHSWDELREIIVTFSPLRPVPTDHHNHHHDHAFLIVGIDVLNRNSTE